MKGPFTVFSPTDAAARSCPRERWPVFSSPKIKDKLVKILTYHVVPGKVMAADVAGKHMAVTTRSRAIGSRSTAGAAYASTTLTW